MIWRLEPEGRVDPASFSHPPGYRALVAALGATAERVLPRLSLGWPAVVEGREPESLPAIGIRVTHVPALPAAACARPDAAARVAAVWGPLRTALEQLAPESLATVGPPAFAMDVAAVEESLGRALPDVFVAWMALHEGTRGRHGPFGWALLDLATAELRRRNLTAALAGVDMDVRADSRVASVWWHPRWFPLATDGSGDLLCLDLAPAPGGTSGQVILFRHDDEERSWIAPSFDAWLESVAVELAAGRLVATEDEDGFYGLIPRAALTGSLASLRVRGETPDAQRARVEHEVIDNPGELARQVVARLATSRTLVLRPEARSMTPARFRLHQAVATAITSSTSRSERPASVLRVLLADGAVLSVDATVEDIAHAIEAAAR